MDARSAVVNTDYIKQKNKKIQKENEKKKKNLTKSRKIFKIFSTNISSHSQLFPDLMLNCSYTLNLLQSCWGFRESLLQISVLFLPLQWNVWLWWWISQRPSQGIEREREREREREGLCSGLQSCLLVISLSFNTTFPGNGTQPRRMKLHSEGEQDVDPTEQNLCS